MKVLQSEGAVHNDFTAIKIIKDFFKSLFKTLIAGTIVGLLARLSAFPIMGFLHNRWITIISSETVNLVYFWIGQLVGSLVFVIYMYMDLRARAWSKLYSILAVIISIIFLFIVGIMLSSL